MNHILNTVYSFFKSIGEAKAAAYFARQGNYKAAQDLYK
jgi:hypothetical protein